MMDFWWNVFIGTALACCVVLGSMSVMLLVALFQTMRELIDKLVAILRLTQSSFEDFVSQIKAG